MAGRTLSSEEITALVDHILSGKENSPGSGLKTVLKARQTRSGDFPLKTLDYDQLHTEGRPRNALREEEKKILELERQLAELRDKLTRTQKEAQAAITEAFGRGSNEGEKRGRQTALEEAAREHGRQIEILQNTTAATLQHIEQARHELFAESLHLTVRLACEAARKIIGVELATNENIVTASIKRALGYIADREKLVIRVAPEDIQVASKTMDFWKPVADRLSDISIVPDRQVGRGGCIVESDSGVADARIDVQFNELTELIEKTWQSVGTDEEEQPIPPQGSQPG